MNGHRRPCARTRSRCVVPSADWPRSGSTPRAPSRRACRAGQRPGPAPGGASSAGARPCRAAAAGCASGCDEAEMTDRPSRPRELGIAHRPAFRRWPGHVVAFRGPGNRPPLVHDQTREAKTCTRGQSGVSVGHEGLLVGGAVPRQLHSTTGGLRHHVYLRRVVTRPQPTCLGSTTSTATRPHPATAAIRASTTAALPLLVTVTGVDPLVAALPVTRAADRVGFGGHHRLRERSGHRLQQIRRRARDLLAQQVSRSTGFALSDAAIAQRTPSLGLCRLEGSRGGRLSSTQQAHHGQVVHDFRGRNPWPGA